MSWKVLVGDTRHTYDSVKDVAVACTVRLWDHGHNGSLWVYPSAVINILLGPGNISTTIQTPKGEVVIINVYLYGCLVVVEDVWLNIGVRLILCVSPEWVCYT